MIRAILASLIAFFSGCSISAQASDKWSVDTAHSSANFEIKHMLISTVTGKFADVSGVVNYDGKNLDKASVDAEIGAKSLNTNVAMRDQHLKNAFECARFPLISFKSHKVIPMANGTFQIAGTLLLHGVSKDIVLLAKPLVDRGLINEHKTLATTATTEINRKDFGISIDKSIDYGGAIIGDKVKVRLDITMQHE